VRARHRCLWRCVALLLVHGGRGARGRRRVWTITATTPVPILPTIPPATAPTAAAVSVTVAPPPATAASPPAAPAPGPAIITTIASHGAVASTVVGLHVRHVRRHTRTASKGRRSQAFSRPIATPELACVVVGARAEDVP
jgi:hypothetical protein